MSVISFKSSYLISLYLSLPEPKCILDRQNCMYILFIPNLYFLLFAVENEFHHYRLYFVSSPAGTQVGV